MDKIYVIFYADVEYQYGEGNIIDVMKNWSVNSVYTSEKDAKEFMNSLKSFEKNRYFLVEAKSGEYLPDLVEQLPEN